MARSAEYVRRNEKRVIIRDGTLAHYRWVVTPRGVALSRTGCSWCHTRFLDNGTAVAGAGFVGHRISDALLDPMGDQFLRISTPAIAFPCLSLVSSARRGF